MNSPPMLDPGLRRRAVRLALRLGVLLLTRGAQAQEIETVLRRLMQALGLRGGDAIVTSSSVTVSYVSPDDAETTTAIRAVRDWHYDIAQLTEASALARAMGDRRIDIAAAEAELDRIGVMTSPYPAWLRFAAPALLSAAVALLFGGSIVDMLATFGVGLAVQPAMARIDRSTLPLFFQTVFGVSATAALVIVLAALRLPIDPSLVLTGGLLRFLPGAQLVNGMRDLVARAIMPGAANLAEVVLLGVAIAMSASLVLGLGQRLAGADLGLSTEGGVDWPPPVTVVAGMAAVIAYALQLGLPRVRLSSVAVLGAAVTAIGHGLVPLVARLDGNGRTLMAAFLVGAVGRFLAERKREPAAIWLTPAILPLLPAPATLVPLLAESAAAQESLRGQALTTAFLIGVGVASGDILVSAWRRHRGPGATSVDPA